ncbi:hypothetical protein RM780_02210 [Streptomyces sp. DSM 44917]|uniref:Transposase n=1 Tax=Streptomyces boetiae TaxID=3075541 RepID=A0ABU2L2J6_9ACTN|nr:hypothetical protein [Streptomyces sp. DSM 44917]MDT0305777.1 hypothetical protein [Streptomyces sp. DSM 44917]
MVNRNDATAAALPVLDDRGLVALFHTGASLPLLAAAGRTHPRQMCARLLGLGLRRVRKGWHAYDPETEARDMARYLRAWYEDGGTIRAFMDLGLEYGEVLALLAPARRRDGRHERRKPCPIPVANLVRRYLNDLEPLSELAVACRVSDNVVKRWLEEAGVTLRTAPQAREAATPRRARQAARASRAPANSRSGR